MRDYSLPSPPGREGVGMRVRSLARSVFLKHHRVYPRQGYVKGGSRSDPHPDPLPKGEGGYQKSPRKPICPPRK